MRKKIPNAKKKKHRDFLRGGPTSAQGIICASVSLLRRRKEGVFEPLFGTAALVLVHLKEVQCLVSEK
jgi:hypothetical protein